MDAYTTTKFLHVAIAIAWLGGGLSLVTLGVLADRAKSDADIMTAIKSVVTLAPRVFVPGSILVLITGLLMVWLGGLTWDAWVVFGLIGVVATGSIGGALLGPLAERAMKLAGDSSTRAEALSCARRLIRLAKLDYVLQFAIVYAMVTKPGWQDVGTLLAIAAIVAVASAYFLRSGEELAAG